MIFRLSVLSSQFSIFICDIYFTYRLIEVLDTVARQELGSSCLIVLLFLLILCGRHLTAGLCLDDKVY